MQLSLRPCVTAGVALAGASVVAVTPIAPTPAALAAEAHAVQLSAATSALPGCSVPSRCDDEVLVNPIQRWAEVFDRAQQTLPLLADAIATAQGALLQQVISNWTGYADTYRTSLESTATAVLNWVIGENASTTTTLPETLTAIQQALAQGDVNAAVKAIQGGVAYLQLSLLGMGSILGIPGEIAQNIADVVKLAGFTSMFQAGFIATTVQHLTTFTTDNLLLAAGQSTQALVDAGKAGDPVAALSAIVNFPADMAYAFLNGTYSPPRPNPVPIPGLPPIPEGWGPGILTQGVSNPLHYLLVTVPKAITNAITPPAAPSVAVAAELDATSELSDIALPADDAPALEKETSAGSFAELTSTLTDAASSINEKATSAITTARSVTLKITPRADVRQTPTAADPSAAAQTTDTSTETIDEPGASEVDADKESAKQTRKEARAAKREARQQAKAERQQAKQEAKAASTGGKHRADKKNSVSND
ncbi:hypothetical protein [Mycolicibacterium sp. HK-90]|uniref:hypothetical protein n=1 Tax=Mycolicibacterium sp. HK-90 TaxID=3056937 RepID=UPI0026585288|nr:hypothetical protein [Mycolicibacterium sp. HK-90]WKG02395.1 hypothetical protein QU592_24765 [Mycolicibacterium sp. HK-90]